MGVNTTPITAVGRLVTGVHVHVVPATGAKVASFRIACQERVYDRKEGTWTDGDRLYMRVSCWRQMADNVADSLIEGDQVVVRGRLKVREYKDNEGTRRTSVEVDAWAIGPDLHRHAVTVDRSRWQAAPDQQALLDVDPPSTPPDPSEEVAQAA